MHCALKLTPGRRVVETISGLVAPVPCRAELWAVGQRQAEPGLVGRGKTDDRISVGATDDSLLQSAERSKAELRVGANRERL
jgi:hypothetical protein